MERTFKLIIPVTDNAGHPIRTDLLENVAVELAEHFGGVTIYPVAAGCYVMPHSQELQCDQTMIVEAVRADSDAGTIAADAQYVESVAHAVGTEFGQDSMFDQEERANETRFVAGRYESSLPAAEREPGAPTRDPQDVLRDLLPR